MPQALAPQTAKDSKQDYSLYSPLNSPYGEKLAHSIVDAANKAGIAPLTLFLAFTADKTIRSIDDKYLASFASLCRGNKISYTKEGLESLALELKKNQNVIGAAGDPVLLCLLRTDKYNALASLGGEFSQWRKRYSKNEYQKENLARLDYLYSSINAILSGSARIKESENNGLEIVRSPLPTWKITYQ